MLKLSEAERIQLAQDLWDSIPPRSGSLGLTEAEIEELELRLAEHQADPSSAIPWEQARAQLRERFGA
ncbi:MAG TPA: addiction module protein [Longimicrobium sp.]|nr:addiction module protein [Longimicrobium sp.]